jgi:hypothetical protein
MIHTRHIGIYSVLFKLNIVKYIYQQLIRKDIYGIHG